MKYKVQHYFDGVYWTWRMRQVCAECGGWDAGGVGFIHHAAWCSESEFNDGKR